jgi:hypothetical protein
MLILLFFGSRMDVTMGGLTPYGKLCEVAGIGDGKPGNGYRRDAHCDA